MTEPQHLSNHHRDTLRKIFEHPTSHNIEWKDVLSLLEATGTVAASGRHGGKLEVRLGGDVEFIEQPTGKDIEPQTVLDLRKMLRAAGYGG